MRGNLGSVGSSQANNWANQRREAVEKAKKIQEERKSNLAKTGEMAIFSGIVPLYLRFFPSLSFLLQR